MGMIQELTELGMNYEEAMTRFMGNESLYESLVPRIVEEIENNPVLCHMEKQDWDTALKNAHMLKGATGNLSITPLYEGYAKVVSLIREERMEESQERLVALLPVQKEIVDCIKKYQ